MKSKVVKCDKLAVIQIVDINQYGVYEVVKTGGGSGYQVGDVFLVAPPHVLGGSKVFTLGENPLRFLFIFLSKPVGGCIGARWGSCPVKISSYATLVHKLPADTIIQVTT